MKYIRESKEINLIHEICEEYRIRDYTINTDGSVDVDGDAYITYGGYVKIPFKFGKVHGGFCVSNNKLLTLENCPIYVGEDFLFQHNFITSLKGCPSTINDNFDCGNNNLTSLIGGPKTVGGDYHCDSNKLQSLEGAPKTLNNTFNCNYNKLTNLINAPVVSWTSHYDENPLPQEIINNIEYIDYIIKRQEDYSIWNKDGSLNSYRFESMLEEIKEEEL